MLVSTFALLGALIGQASSLCSRHRNGSLVGNYSVAYNWTATPQVNRTCPGLRDVTLTTSSRNSATSISSFPLPASADGTESTAKQLIPVANPAIDASSLSHLIPSDVAVLNYAEPATSGKYAAQIEFAMTFQQVTLENSAYVSSVTKSGNTLLVVFTSIQAFDAVQYWPSSGLVLITNSPGLNMPNERGLYITLSTAWNAAALTVMVQVKGTSWKEIATTMTISYGEVVSGDFTPAPVTTTVTSYYTVSSSRTSAVLVTTYTPIAIAYSTTVANALTGQPQTSYPTTSTTTHELSGNASYASNLAVTQAPSLTTSGLSTQTIPASSLSATTSAILSPVAITTAGVLNAAQEAAKSSILARLSYDSTGEIAAPTMTAIAQVQSIDVEAQLKDSVLQAANQAKLTGAGLLSPDALLATSEDALVGNAAQAYAITSDMKITEVFPSGIDTLTDSGNTKRAVYTPTSQSEAVKRGLFGDILNSFNDLLTSDLITAMCETCDDIKTLEDGYNSAVALYDITHPKSQPPPLNKWDTTQQLYTKIGYPAGGLVQGDSGSGKLICTNCGIEVSSLVIQGTIVVVIATSSIITAVVQVTMNSVSNLVFDMETTGAATGSFDSTLSTTVIESLSVSNVFTITPSFIWGIGASWHTDMATSFTAGASLTLTDAAASLDLSTSKVGKSDNWQPSTAVTYPSISVPGNIVMSMYEKTMISMTLTIFGNTIQNAAILTVQNNLAFTASVDSTNTKRSEDVATSHLAKRSFWSNIIKGITSAQSTLAAIAAAARAVSSAPFSGMSPVSLFSQNYPFGSRCFALPNNVTCGTTISTGTFLSSAPKSTFQDCATWCESWGSASCAAFAFDSAQYQSCRLYTVVTMTAGSSTSTYAVVKAPSPAACPNDVAAGSFTHNLVNYKVSCGTSVTTGVFLASTPESSFQACASWCESYGSANCAAFYYDPSQYQSCQLYKSVTATSVSSTATYAIIQVPVCPAGVSSGEYAHNSAEYKVTCGTIVTAGEFLASAPESTFQDCATWCESYGSTSCAAFSFDTAQGQSCSLYNSVSSTAFSTTATYAVVQIPVCPAGVTAGAYAYNSADYQVTCGTTVTTGNFVASAPKSTFQDCATWCESWGAASCAAFSFDPAQGQSCTLYSSVSVTTYSSTATYAVVKVPICPTGYSAGSFAQGGASFKMLCGTSMASSDWIGSAHFDSISGCIDWANTYGTYCAALTYDFSTYQNCNLYHTIGTTASSNTLTTVQRV
ncbi:Putative uncharacterized protein [Taphrina deformans PYCC 5710]|uniref:Apple domain-containing protein n=1 Tax=Taphrina deformans (strain PYCC 5710 / ATCC 11124 / CBS 356.35 / IMI 108563 / JCM 9778 / NBRC 8474) TaxID=1097556 RepID=R4X8Q8_TAPDE|nr:Putative uncharacterized protein [Taphrina deformans PYCC 5710]|eukprot:CCG82023.1 Putative uncharacterized protein [Taphrina deformans PYCC 5710]